MPTRSRRRPMRSAGSAPKPVATLQPGRFSDMLLTCQTCGAQFVFTVEEQRQLDAAGLPVEPPTQCPRCAPRSLPPQAVPVTEASPATASSTSRPARQSEARNDDMPEVHYVVRSYGHVKGYDLDKGEGSIIDDDDGREYHVRRSALEGSVRSLSEGQAVEFEILGHGWEAEAVHVLIV